MQRQKFQAVASRRNITGQGMTEYIIIVALIAIAAIAAVGAFGGVVKDSFVGMAQALSGNDATEVTVENAPAAGSTEGSLGKFN